MANTYEKKAASRNNIFYTIATIIMLCVIFLTMVVSFYSKAKNDAYENLHVQTKQIKDDLTLQLKSDRENLITMASFAAKVYADGDNYSIMFESFKPIGLFDSIGILNPDNTFITKDGTKDLNGKISFEEEAALGMHITGRVPSRSIEGKDVVRSAVPITIDGETVGILYGIMLLETLGEKYNTMANLRIINY